MVAIQGFSIWGYIAGDFGGMCHLGLLGRWLDTHSHSLASSALDSQVGFWVRRRIICFRSKLRADPRRHCSGARHIEAYGDFSVFYMGVHCRFGGFGIFTISTVPIKGMQPIADKADSG